MLKLADWEPARAQIPTGKRSIWRSLGHYQRKHPLLQQLLIDGATLQTAGFTLIFVLYLLFNEVWFILFNSQPLLVLCVHNCLTCGSPLSVFAARAVWYASVHEATGKAREISKNVVVPVFVLIPFKRSLHKVGHLLL